MAGTKWAWQQKDKGGLKLEVVHVIYLPVYPQKTGTGFPRVFESSCFTYVKGLDILGGTFCGGVVIISREVTPNAHMVECPWWVV